MTDNAEWWVVEMVNGESYGYLMVSDREQEPATTSYIICIVVKHVQIGEYHWYRK